MRYKGIILLAFGFWICLMSKSQPKIILKLDDFEVKNGVCPSTLTLDYLVRNKIKAGLGFIANRLDYSTSKTLQQYVLAKNFDGERLFEVWNHGLDHFRPEFLGTGYVYQKNHFDRATKIIEELLGVKLRTFGTPYNESDSITNRVVSENYEYKVLLFSKIEPNPNSGILNLINRTNMENGTGNPEYSYFVANYNKFKDIYSDYMVLQGHPNKWKAGELDQFKQIVVFLIAQGCEFVTPYEYYLRIHN
jgi:peptidoglycan/xylan/chitin deacetylase (PgdA/CDA1 family)